MCHLTFLFVTGFMQFDYEGPKGSFVPVSCVVLLSFLDLFIAVMKFGKILAIFSSDISCSPLFRDSYSMCIRALEVVLRN